MRARQLNRIGLAVLVMISMALALGLPPTPVRADGHDTQSHLWAQHEEVNGGAGIFTSDLTSTTWSISGETPPEYHGTFGARIDTIDIEGERLSGSDSCIEFHGPGSGTLTRGGDPRTYNLFNLGVTVRPLNLTIVGNWLDSTGRRGIMWALGWTNSATLPEGHPDYCRVWIMESKFVQDNREPEEIEDIVTGFVPQNENTPPDAPQLVFPPDGYTFLPDEIQRFSILAEDANEDLYFGKIEVKRPDNSFWDSFWPTALVPSGDVSTGLAPLPYPIDARGYEWRARANDLLEDSDYSEIREFFVGLPPLVEDMLTGMDGWNDPDMFIGAE